MDIARSSLKIFASRLVGSIISFIGIAFFARELGSHRIGVFFLFQALLGMMSIPANLGINQGVAKRLSEGKSAKNIIPTAILLKLLPLSLLIGGILLLRDSVNSYVGAQVASLLALAILLQEMTSLTKGILNGELRVGATALPALSRQIVFVGVGAVFVLSGFGVSSLIYSLLFGFLAMLLWSLSRISVTLGTPSLSYARSLFGYSKYAFISSVGGYFYNWMDIVIIGFFLTQSEVGIYEMAWRVTAVLTLFSTSIATTIFPQVSQWDAEDATAHIETLLPKAIVPPLFFVIPAFFGILLFSHDILGLLFGAEYTAGWLVLIILTFEKVIQSVHLILGRSLQAINRPDLAAKSGIVAIVLNFALNIGLVVHYGIIGAAIATLLSFIVNSILHAYYLSHFISIDVPYVQIKGSLIAAFGMTIVLYAVQSVVLINTLPRLLATIFLGVIVYGGFALLIPSLRLMLVGNVRRALS